MTSSAPSWAAVVVNHNGGSLLERCIRSLLADQASCPDEIVVVDNASTDGSATALEGLVLPGVRVVHAPGNLGYAKGANLGIATTRAEIVAVLNPDTEIRPGTAGAMNAVLALDASIGAAGPRVLNPDGSDYPSARIEPGALVAAGHAFGGFISPNNRFSRAYKQLDTDRSESRSVDWVSGCAIWLSRGALDVVGGWDERYFMYMEDVDLCARLRAAGFDVRYEPSGVVVHVQGASTSRRPYRMIVEHHRSMARFVASNTHGVRRMGLPAVVSLIAVRAVLAIARHRLDRTRAPRRRTQKPSREQLDSPPDGQGLTNQT